MEPELAEMLKSVAESRRKESLKRVGLARERLLGSRALGVVIRDEPRPQSAAPPVRPQKSGGLPRTTSPSSAPEPAPAMLAVGGAVPPSPDVPPSPVRTSPKPLDGPPFLEQATPEPSDVPSPPEQTTPPPMTAAGGSRKRGRGEETSPIFHDAGSDGLGQDDVATPGGEPITKVTEVGERSSTLRSPASALDAHTQGILDGIRIAVETVFETERKELLACSQKAEGRLLEHQLKLSDMLRDARAEAAREKAAADAAEEKLRESQAEVHKSRSEEARGRLHAIEKEVAELKVSLGVSEAAQADMRAQLQAEKERADAAETATNAATQTIGGLRNTAKLQGDRIAELEARLRDQIAQAGERERILVEKAEGLEKQVADKTAVDAQALEAARREAVQNFRDKELEAALKQAMALGADQGQSEGYNLGFYKALEQVLARHPELKPEAARYSVEKALEEDADAAMAAELQAQYDREGGDKAPAVPNKGKGKMTAADESLKRRRKQP